MSKPIGKKKTAISADVTDATSKGSPPTSSGSSQQTLGAIPKIRLAGKEKADGGTSSYEAGRQGKDGSLDQDATDGSATLTTSSSSSSSSSILASNSASSSSSSHSSAHPKPSAYSKKPAGKDNTDCFDITSFRFTPDYDRKVGILMRKMRGDPPERISSGSDRNVLHQFPAVSSADVTGVPLLEAPGATSLTDGKDRFITLADFASKEPNEPTVFHTVARKDAIVFVIVARPHLARGKLSWDVPTLTQCQDFSNEFISKIYEGGNNWARAYVRSGRWGKVGTILLSSELEDELAEFRRQFAVLSYRDMAFDTYPKDALTARADVSILLRASMKTFKTEMIPTVLFARNKDLVAGMLRVLASTFFSAEELSHKGESKEHWRAVDLKGDDQFMRCLRFIPEGHSFLLGYDSVQIRGGLRPQDHNLSLAGSKRSWADIQPPAVPLLQDPRNIFPTPQSSRQIPDENSNRGAGKRGRGARNGRRGGRGNRGFRGTS